MSLTIKVHVTTTANYVNSPQSTRKYTRSFLNYDLKSQSRPITWTVSRRSRRMSGGGGGGAMVVKSSLIEPDGGVVVDLVVAESELEVKTAEAEAMPRVGLTRIDLEWVHVISEGWASPLKGFMRENEYLQSLHFNCLKLGDGSFVNMSLPIVLAIDDETKERIGSESNVSLVGPGGDLVGILRR